MSNVESGYYYRRTEHGPAVDLSQHAADLTEGTAWRTSGKTTPDELTLSQGSRAWLRLMGAWQYTSKTSRRWPFQARLTRDEDDNRVQVIIEDDFGWWASHGRLLSDAAAHGDVLMKDLLRRLDATPAPD